jgi:transposase-like protein
MYFKDGASITAISKRISTPRNTIRRWIRIFAEENAIEMPTKTYCKHSDKQANNPDIGSMEEVDATALKA